MDAIELKTADFIHSGAGASVSFHLIRHDEPASLDAANLHQVGNILFHNLTGRSAPHTHQFAEILFVLKGRIRHEVNGERQVLEPGNIVFLRPFDVHYFDPPRHDEQCELINLAFPVEILGELSHFLGGDTIVRRYTAPVTPHTVHTDPAQCEELALRLLRISTLMVTAVETGRALARSLVGELFCRYFAAEDGNPAGLGPQRPEWLDALCARMRLLPDLRDGLAEMRRLAPCTPEHLCKACRRHLRQSPTDFINSLRSQRAAKALIETDTKVYAIAMDLGFQSLSRFYKVFRQAYGVSPARYRQLHAGNYIPAPKTAGAV